MNGSRLALVTVVRARPPRTVRGTTPPNSPIFSRPTGRAPTATSRYTRCVTSTSSGTAELKSGSWKLPSTNRTGLAQIAG
jgi:hypothetical protein